MIGWSLLGLGLLLTIYTYFGYPALVLLRARRRPRPLRPDPAWRPTVTVCLACRDEEERVAAKLEQILALDYPAELLEILLLDDGSGDGTAALVRERFGPRGVRLLRRPEPRGKAAGLNVLAASARSEVLLLLDCRQRIEPGVLRALLAPLADPQAGAVSGELMLEEEDGRPSTQGVGLYWQVEKAIRRGEALAGSTVGVTGALYVVRRHLFPTLPEGLLLDDLAVPLAVARQRYRIGFAPSARAWDRVADPARERDRKLRTLGGNVELFLHWPWVLLPWKNPLWFGYLSHKLARLLVPYALLTMLLGCLLVASPWRWLL
ncbi:MAG: glycosyltransferase, partial [Deltaproteobacteria bacterium]|nr:glycosyltransferase [Deltaproteobacteria bacterium]